jgi:CubicO group peptidase (beta-lactamase class C family)
MTVSVDSLRERLEAARAKSRIPALGAAIVTTDDQEMPTWVTGERVRGGGDPASVHDLWHIGSCAKAMTGALFARLVERGLTTWEATLPDLFPDLNGIDPAWRGTRIDQVLTHRAGLPANLDLAEFDAWSRDERPVTDQRTAVAERALSQPSAKPGSFRYSNLGYIVAGAAIERIVGRSWEEAVVDEVLAPLGITSTGFGAPTGAQPWGHRSRWHGIGRGAPVDPGSPEHPALRADNPPVMSPAGRIHLTLEDWARFIRIFLTDGGMLLSTASVSKLATPPGGKGPKQGIGWAVPPGKLSRDVAVGQQGSNTAWVATALIDASWDRAALVVCNDGRGRMLAVTGHLAAGLLAERGDGPQGSVGR